MSDNKRQDAVDALKDRLATVRTANGYATDIGARVFSWRKAPVTSAETPCTEVKDGKNETRLEGAPMGRAYQFLDVEIVLSLQGGGTAIQARSAIADVKKAIGLDDKFGGVTKWATPETDEINIEQTGDTTGAATVNITIVYETDRWGA